LSASRFAVERLAGLAGLDPGAGRSPPRRQSRASRPIAHRPRCWRGSTAGRGARHVAGIEQLALERLAGSPDLMHVDHRRSRRQARRRDGGPLVGEAVASGGMIDSPPALRRGPWCAESGLTKALAAGRFTACNRTPRPAAVASAMGQKQKSS